jgi:hypothetical protein
MRRGCCDTRCPASTPKRATLGARIIDTAQFTRGIDGHTYSGSPEANAPGLPGLRVAFGSTSSIATKLSSDP